MLFCDSQVSSSKDTCLLKTWFSASVFQDLEGRYGPEEVLLANNHFAELENEGGKGVCLQVWKMQTAGLPPLYNDSITPWLRIKAGFCSSLSG